MGRQRQVDCCLLVPLYRPSLSRAEALSLVISHGRGGLAADLFLLHPPSLTPFVTQLRDWFLKHTPGSPCFQSLEFEEEHFSSLETYSALMLNPSLYERLSSYVWMLVVQTDALLLSDHWSDWLTCPLSYVGAPWFEGLHRPSQPLRLIGGGNGGVSLRRIADCSAVLHRGGWLYPALRALERACLPRQRFRAEIRALRHWTFRAGSPNTIPVFEDLFWSFSAPVLQPQFLVASALQAARFAFETEPRHLWTLTGSLPVACHAYERYDRNFWFTMFEQDHTLTSPFQGLASSLYEACRRFPLAGVTCRP